MIQLPERPVRRYVGAIYRRPYLAAFIAFALAGAMIFAGRVITLKSKIRDLLPDSAASVQAMEILQERLGSADILVVALMSDDFDRVKPALPAIAKALEAHPEIARVEYRQDVEMIDRNALIIFPSLTDLRAYHDELTEAIKAEVGSRMQLLDDDDKGGGDPAAGAAAADAPKVYPRYTFTWVEHEKDDGLSNLGRTFRGERGAYREYFYNRAYTTVGLQVFPTKSSGDLAFAREILADTDRIVHEAIAAELGPVGPDGAVTRVVLGGGYRGALEESDQIKNDITSSVAWCMGLLSLVLVLWFRSIRAFFCVLLPLAVGICWTIGLVGLTVGYLNLITAFIFAVLLGLGIDFGIHFYGRYREERAAGHEPLEAMVQTHLSCGEASLLAALTTAASFGALTIADFRGFSQFGGVAAGGVIFSLLAVMWVFTALTFIFERWWPLRMMGYRVDRTVEEGIVRRRFPLGATTVVIAVLIGAVGFALLPRVEFEMNFNRLGEQEKARSEHEEITYGTTQSTSPAVIFADSPEEARAIFDELKRRTTEQDPHPRIKSFQALFALVPTEQEEKGVEVRRICRKLARKVKLFEGDPRDGADELLRHCDPKPFGVEELPAWVKSTFSDREGRLGEFIFVSPRGSTNDGEVALAFREEMLSLKSLDGKPPVVSGKPMIWADVLLAMEADGVKTTAASLLTVFVLILAFVRRIKATLLILMPLTLALGFTAGVMAVLGIKLNFFNMLAVPTLIGMGVDNGVHFYHRHQQLGPDSARYIVQTTGSAAVLSTVTTMIGFGSLLLANHQGLNSLGVLAMTGMGAAMVTSLVVMPAAFQWSDDHKRAKAKRAGAGSANGGPASGTGDGTAA